jgi:hypothetical protein
MIEVAPLPSCSLYESARERLFMNLARRSVISVTLAILVLACQHCEAQQEPLQKTSLEWIRPSEDKTHFVGVTSGRRIVMWGVNYDHDDKGRLLEDYWNDQWDTVVADMHEIKALGANVVRIHLQLGRFMTTATQADKSNLERLGMLVRLAEETGLYLDWVATTSRTCPHGMIPWKKQHDGRCRHDSGRRWLKCAKRAPPSSVTI